MEIVLEHADPERWPAPPGWTVVGRVGHQALAYDTDRRPHLVGDGEPEPLDPAAVNAALVASIDAAASRLWPGGWSHALPLAFAINRRTVQPDRIAKNGLPPTLLRALGSAAGEADAEGVGWLLSALARYADEHGGHVGVPEDLDDAERAAANALAVLRQVRRGQVKKSAPEE